MIKIMLPPLRRFVGGVFRMFKAIEFYAVFLGFVLGIAYDLLEKLFQRDADTSIIDVMLTWAAQVSNLRHPG